MATTKRATKLAFSSIVAVSSASFLFSSRSRPDRSTSPEIGTLPKKISGYFAKVVPPAFSPENVVAALSSKLSSAPRDNLYNLALSRLQYFFRDGDYYVWLYCDMDGNPTSWERYSITQTKPYLVIEMSTKFSQEEDYKTHHRMKVDLQTHLDAHESREGWRVGFEYNHPVDGWTVFGTGENVQCFEEKFDIFTMLFPPSTVDDSATIQTRDLLLRPVMIDSKNTLLCRPERHAYTEAWYGTEEHLGIAVWKDFKEHCFKLIERGRVDQSSKYVNVTASIKKGMMQRNIHDNNVF